MVWNLTKLVRHQTTYPGNSENTNKDKYQTNKQTDKNNNNNNKTTKGITYSSCRRSKTKGKSWKKPEENNLLVEGQG